MRHVGKGRWGPLRQIAGILAGRKQYTDGSFTQMLGDTSIVRDVERVVQQHV